MQTDEDLMAAYVKGDESAFRTLFERHSPALLRVMRHQLRKPEDARDLVQQTFLQLHRSRNDFREDAKLKPWLFTIAMNLKREYFRRAARRPEAPLSPDNPEPAIAPRGQEQVEARDELVFAVQGLPEDQREVILLHWLGGIALPEVAEVVGASLSAVKVRAHRGYAAMRRALGADPGNSEDP